MSNIAIKAENLSKAYQLGEIGTGTISRDLERWYAKIRGKEDPFLRIGETNDRSTKGVSNIVWSLKDLNFEIQEGDAVGIIGRNGAGKSTLLKILSKVTGPTTGKISGKGRIASLLEVGTGFHPELSGRENIYLNGAILGMRKHEIKRKFDEIVDFAGVERYIDTPVKRYSSGMYVRLAFAVAAHLESEILIVDEVLAVGDAEFQKKCLGKMGEVSKGEGRTVLFVSHNMSSISSLCKKAMLLENGQNILFDRSDVVIKQYHLKSSLISNLSINDRKDRIGNGAIKFSDISINNQNFSKDGHVEITLHIENNLERVLNLSIAPIRVDLNLQTQDGIIVTQLSSYYLSNHYEITSSTKEIKFIINNIPLTAGKYLVDLYSKINEDESDWISNAFELNIEENNYYNSGKILQPADGIVMLDYKVEFI